MMDVRDTEKHERVLYVGIDRRMLEDIILQAVSNRADIPLPLLRKHGKVEIEQNMEGSPSYHSGYKASVRATIPLEAPEASDGR